MGLRMGGWRRLGSICSSEGVKTGVKGGDGWTLRVFAFCGPGQCIRKKLFVYLR
jgi:hypothetical protein